ncbi:MAG: tRNA uridine(34) 5-carboxymethylaminomethyl modification radical SAM/GNAT enzyme Elp3 [Chloroflexi bacterium]|nr:tRNA uridine(34) 5-carboxymethylaminomethyl modification radical SAM/GNAT enzyme Elp3 [Chloroflexota bacterium]
MTRSVAVPDLDIQSHLPELLRLFDAVRAADEFSPRKLNALAVKHVHERGLPVPQSSIIEAYRQLTAQGVIPFEAHVLERLRLKPTRTISGVAPVAVLTGPYPCPADCIFCPEAKGIPRSYLPDEPAVQRAKRARFDPYRETATRIQAMVNMGHSTDKVELLVIGATWSAYPHKYQEWFIRRCFDAMNGQESATLEEAQRVNETAAHRNVGMVVETRPDYITLDEVRRMRWLGVTKVQLGAQSLDDTILAANRRGHTVEATRRAVRMLRLAGFKLHLHWMPNLLGATPESDREDFGRLWNDPALRPDELKIYPCSLITGTELYARWQAGEFRPYTDDELIELLIACKQVVPPYCRLSRVVRDIPAQYIAAGSTQSQLREVVQREMRRRGLQCQCVRCREVRGEKLETGSLRLDDHAYATDATLEHFLTYLTPDRGRLAGFLRLSLPRPDAPRDEVLDEVRGCAMIREVHVYGPALALGTATPGEPQHSGLGKQLAEQAMEIARRAGYRRIAVIAAIGTREYYRKLGFELGEPSAGSGRGLYMTRAL